MVKTACVLGSEGNGHRSLFEVLNRFSKVLKKHVGVKLWKKVEFVLVKYYYIQHNHGQLVELALVN